MYDTSYITSTLIKRIDAKSKVCFSSFSSIFFPFEHTKIQFHYSIFSLSFWIAFVDYVDSIQNIAWFELWRFTVWIGLQVSHVAIIVLFG